MSELSLANKRNQWICLEQYDCYLLERVPYCTRPEVPAEQCMNIYVPGSFLSPDGSIREGVHANGFTAATVPVVFENGLAGYKEAEPFSLEDDRSAGMDFLKAGFVYVSCGCRGRSSVNEKGERCGKAPLSLVDLKAGIRFLKHNAGILPGNMNRIVSVGISAGGAMSTLLGSTGNSSDYERELERMGAVMTETDDVFAAQCYCPITDLDHADLAYEWMFQGRTHYDGMAFVGFPEGDLDPYAQALSRQLAEAYPSYFNSLGLLHPKTKEPLVLEKGHAGSGLAYLMEVLEASATKFLKKLEQGETAVQSMEKKNRTETDQTEPDQTEPDQTETDQTETDQTESDQTEANQIETDQTETEHTASANVSVEDYIAGNYLGQRFDPGKKEMVSVPGVDKHSWLSWDGGHAKITSLEDMQETYHTRLKLCPAFDDRNLIQAENQEFGTPRKDKMHFDTELPALLEMLREQFPKETAEYLRGYEGILEDKALAERKYLLNPMNYIGTEKTCDLAPHYRIRVGSRDADTSLTVSMTLALKLMQTGKTEVDYEIVWDEGHGRADYPGEVAEWIRKICFFQSR